VQNFTLYVELDKYRIDTPLKSIPVGQDLILKCYSSGKVKWFFKAWNSKSQVHDLNMQIYGM